LDQKQQLAILNWLPFPIIINVFFYKITPTLFGVSYFYYICLINLEIDSVFKPKILLNSSNMNKLFLFTLLTFSFTNFQAQNDNIGFKAGANYANLTNFEDGYSPRFAYHFGLVAELTITEKFSVQPEILYSKLGSQFKDGDNKSTLSENYLSVPLMFKYNFSEKMSIEVGPYLGLMLTAKSKGEMEGESFEEDVIQGFNQTDFGYALGLSYSITNNIVGSVRYNLGTKNVIKNSEDKINNSALQLSLGYNLF
jgi:opacity protein-like surface antigen